MLAEGNNKLINDVIINVSRDPLGIKLSNFWGLEKKLLRNSYPKRQELKVLKIIPDLKSKHFLIYLNSVGLSVWISRKLFFETELKSVREYWKRHLRRHLSSNRGVLGVECMLYKFKLAKSNIFTTRPCSLFHE